MKKTFISLGSNADNALECLQHARNALSEAGLPPLLTSPIYQTEPQGYKDQPWFANQVLCVDAAHLYHPQTLLKCLLQIEQDMGRVRSPDPALRYGPRIIDLDILLIDDVIINTDTLTVPHPRLQERAFVLIPLLDIAPQQTLPDGQPLDKVLKKLVYHLDERRIFQK